MGDMKNPSDSERLARYVRDGKLRQYPGACNDARALVLEWLAGLFAPGRRYAEAEVNEVLAGHAIGHALDHATLRRYLVDAGLLARDHGEYWRTEK